MDAKNDLESSNDVASDTQQFALDFIKQKILNLEYPGGTWLKPQAIAEEMGVSRTPVREALRGLEMEGFVSTRPTGGVVVTELSVGDVADLFDIRGQLEAMVATDVVAALNKSRMRELENLVATMDKTRANTKEWMKLHNEFHAHISSLSGRSRLVGELERYCNLIQPYIRLYIDVYGTPELPAFEHDEILQALKSGDAAIVHKTMKDHVDTTKNRVLSFLTRHYQYREGKLGTGS